MKDYRKDNLIRTLRDLEARIGEMQEAITSVVKEPNSWCASENLAAYSARMNGYIHERRGICVALNLLGYKVVWKDEHVVGIEWDGDLK